MPRTKKSAKISEAAVLELQNAPVAEARKEAEHAADAPAKPKRGRKAGAKAAKRAPPAAPVKRRGRPKGSKSKPKAAGKATTPGANRLGRPPGSKNKPKIDSPAGTIKRGPGRPPRAAAANGLGQISAVVEGMVAQRTREVLQDALAALQQAAAAVERAM